MTNFSFLLSEPDFSAFSEIACSVEKLLNTELGSCVINCRRAMELAVKWMFSVDAELKMPYQDNLNALMSDVFALLAEAVGWNLNG